MSVTPLNLDGLIENFILINAIGKFLLEKYI